jgi:hypothetical protein
MLPTVISVYFTLTYCSLRHFSKIQVSQNKIQFKKNEIYIYIKCSADFYCILVLLYVILFYYTLLTYLIDKRAISQEVLFYITRNFDVHFYVIIIM